MIHTRENGGNRLMNKMREVQGRSLVKQERQNDSKPGTLIRRFLSRG